MNTKTTNKLNKSNRVVLTFFFTLILLSLFFLTSCSQMSSSSHDIDYHKGTKGLTITFLDQAPPKEVYEKTPFDVQLIIHNEGAFNLADKYRAILSLGYTQHYVTPITNQLPQGSGQMNYVDKQNIQLYGKSYYFPEGQEDYFPLDRFMANKIQGTYETRSTSFDVSICYPYETIFSDTICVDTDPNNVDAREKTCQTKDKSYSGGQGAPIAVTAVESKMVPRGVYIQPIFIIHLRHEGDGTFYLPNVTSGSYGSLACDLNAMNEDTISRVNVSARLGAFDLDCKPNKVYFKDNEATVQCRIPERTLGAVGGNFYSTLQVKADYLYSQSASKEMTIKRSSSTAFNDETPDDGKWSCYPWQYYDSSSKTCIDYCDYCADLSHRNDPHCTVYDTLPNDDAQRKSFKTTMTCAFPSANDCYEAGSHCLLQKGLCPTGTYCGEPFCTYLSSRNSAPHISSSTQSDVADGFVFFCEDSDANQGIRACGCSQNGFYKLVDASKSCESTEFHTKDVFHGSMVKGSESKVVGGVRMNYPLGNMVIPDGKKLCLGVKDLAGKYAIKEVTSLS